MPETRSITVYFDEARKSGLIVVDPAELTARETAGAAKKIACALGIKDPQIAHGRPMLFLLGPDEAKTLGDKLLLFAMEQTS
jgi:hypothetical protein